MRIRGEPVEPVTSFASLKSGDIVYAEICHACFRRWCRAILTVRNAAGDWLCAPPCVPVAEGEAVCIYRASSVGGLYRVVNPPRVEQTTVRKKERIA